MRSIMRGTRRRFGPNNARWLSVGQSIRSSGAPRNSRISSGFVPVEGTFQVGREESVLAIHAGS